MAYQTGSAANPAALVSVINTFAAANGWTNTSGVLSSGSGSFIELEAAPSFPNDELKISGANNINMTTGLCTQSAKIWIDELNWPVTYHLQSWTSPKKQITCFVNYSAVKWQWLAFGEVVKYGTWTGGNWFGASCGQNATPTYPGSYSEPVWALLPTSSGPGGSAQGYYSMPGAPFWGCRNIFTFTGGYASARNSFVHAEIDGNIWPGEGVIDGQYPNYAGYANPLHRREYQPNSWDGHAVLLPFWLIMNRADSNVSALGHIANFHSVRIDYLDPGEIITIGSDKWMVFPWIQKDIQNVDGYGDLARTSGTMGVAIKYDGP